MATLFGTITLWRMLYQAVHGVEPAVFPLEIRLGLEAGRATPALAERAARAAVALPQDAVLAVLRTDHGVRWSVASLRAVIAAVATGMEAHCHDTPRWTACSPGSSRRISPRGAANRCWRWGATG